MKLVKFLIAFAIVFALGGVLGVTIGNSSGPQAIVPQRAAEAQPAQSNAAPAKAAAPSRVGVVGVLQAVGSKSLSVQTKDGMQLMTIDGDAGIEKGSSAIDQLKAGDKVAVWAQQVNGQLIVTKIVVVPPKPERMHYVGLIANVTADKIDVVGQQGETTSFRIDATLQKLPDAQRAPQVGDTVTVVAKPDPLGDGWLAVAIVKQ
jgi:Cu/Ag efflux protein CusF